MKRVVDVKVGDSPAASLFTNISTRWWGHLWEKILTMAAYVARRRADLAIFSLCITFSRVGGGWKKILNTTRFFITLQTYATTLKLAKVRTVGYQWDDKKPDDCVSKNSI